MKSERNYTAFQALLDEADALRPPPFNGTHISLQLMADSHISLTVMGSVVKQDELVALARHILAYYSNEEK